MNVTVNSQMAKLAINKSLLKEFGNDRTVYLNDGEEFQIQLFNPYDYVIGARIKINGEMMSYNYLVLRPGERVWLDRYIDNAQKMKFHTYETENSAAGRCATRNNGVVEIEFHREVICCENPNITYLNHYHHDNNIWDGQKLVKPWHDTVYGLATDMSLKANCESFSNDANDAIQTFCSSVTQVDKNEVNDACATATYANNTSKSIETGRIEKGGYSKQKFDTINTNFEYYAFSTETIHILPMSRKPVTSNDLKKIYCHECGRKIKSGFKYCPFCGAQQ